MNIRKGFTLGLIVFFILCLLLNTCGDLDGVTEIASLKNRADTQEKVDALEKLTAYYIDAKHHKDQVINLAYDLARARHNIEAITDAALYVSQFPYHTDTVISIARYAAESASKIKTEEDWAKIKQEIVKMREGADYSSIEEALKASKDQDKT